MILNQAQAQAQAVYSAMVALNNVGGRLQASCGVDPEGLQVVQRKNGSVAVGYVVTNAQRGTILESFSDQAAFAAAYGLI